MILNLKISQAGFMIKILCHFFITFTWQTSFCS